MKLCSMSSAFRLPNQSSRLLRKSTYRLFQWPVGELCLAAMILLLCGCTQHGRSSAPRCSFVESDHIDASLADSDRELLIRLKSSPLAIHRFAMPAELPLPLFQMFAENVENPMTRRIAATTPVAGIAIEDWSVKYQGDIWSSVTLQNERHDISKALSKLPPRSEIAFSVRSIVSSPAPWRLVQDDFVPLPRYSIDYWITWYFQPLSRTPVNMFALAHGSDGLACDLPGVSPTGAVIVSLEPFSIIVKSADGTPLPWQCLTELIWAGWWKVGRYVGIARTLASNRVLWLREGTRFSQGRLHCKVVDVGNPRSITLEVRYETLDEFIR